MNALNIDFSNIDLKGYFSKVGKSLDIGGGMILTCNDYKYYQITDYVSSYKIVLDLQVGETTFKNFIHIAPDQEVYENNISITFSNKDNNQFPTDCDEITVKTGSDYTVSFNEVDLGHGLKITSNANVIGTKYDDTITATGSEQRIDSGNGNDILINRAQKVTVSSTERVKNEEENAVFAIFDKSRRYLTDISFSGSDALICGTKSADKISITDKNMKASIDLGDDDYCDDIFLAGVDSVAISCALTEMQNASKNSISVGGYVLTNIDCDRVNGIVPPSNDPLDLRSVSPFENTFPGEGVSVYSHYKIGGSPDEAEDKSWDDYYIDVKVGSAYTGNGGKFHQGRNEIKTLDFSAADNVSLMIPIYDFITNFYGTKNDDVIILDEIGGISYAYGNGGTDEIINYSGIQFQCYEIEKITNSRSNATIKLADATTVSVNGSETYIEYSSTGATTYLYADNSTLDGNKKNPTVYNYTNNFYAKDIGKIINEKDSATIRMLSGDANVSGSKSANIIGTDSNNTIQLSANDSTVDGGAGNDTVHNYAQNFSIKDVEYVDNKYENAVITLTETNSSEIKFVTKKANVIGTSGADTLNLCVGGSSVDLGLDNAADIITLSGVTDNNAISSAIKAMKSSNAKSVTIGEYTLSNIGDEDVINGVSANDIHTGLDLRDVSVIDVCYDNDHVSVYGSGKNYTSVVAGEGYTLNSKDLADVIKLDDDATVGVLDFSQADASESGLKLSSIHDRIASVIGSKGNDTITVSNNNKFIDGNEGIDKVVISTDSVSVKNIEVLENKTKNAAIILLEKNSKEISVSGSSTKIVGSSGTDSISSSLSKLSVENIEYIKNTAAAAEITITEENSQAITVDSDNYLKIIGSTGNDTVAVSGSVEYINSNGGNDNITLGEGSQSIDVSNMKSGNLNLTGFNTYEDKIIWCNTEWTFNKDGFFTNGNASITGIESASGDDTVEGARRIVIFDGEGKIVEYITATGENNFRYTFDGTGSSDKKVVITGTKGKNDILTISGGGNIEFSDFEEVVFSAANTSIKGNNDVIAYSVSGSGASVDASATTVSATYNISGDSAHNVNIKAGTGADNIIISSSTVNARRLSKLGAAAAETTGARIDLGNDTAVDRVTVSGYSAEAVKTALSLVTVNSSTSAEIKLGDVTITNVNIGDIINGVKVTAPQVEPSYSGGSSSGGSSGGSGGGSGTATASSKPIITASFSAEQLSTITREAVIAAMGATANLMTSTNEVAVLKTNEAVPYSYISVDKNNDGKIAVTVDKSENISNNIFYVLDTSKENNISAAGSGKFEFSSEWNNFTTGAVVNTVDASAMAEDSNAAIAAVQDIKTGAGTNIAWGYTLENVGVTLKENSGYDMLILWDGVDKSTCVANFEYDKDEVWLYGKGNAANGEELTFLTDIDSVINQYNITHNEHGVVVQGNNGSMMVLGGASDSLKIFTTPDHANTFTVKFEGDKVNYYNANNELVGTQA